MLDFFRYNFLEPLARRTGTFAAGLLLAAVPTLAPDAVASVELAVTTVSLIGIDLFLSKVWPRKVR